MHCHPRYTLVSSRHRCWSPTPRPRVYHSCPVSLNTSWPRLEWRRTLKFWNYWMEKIHKHWPRWWPTPWSRCPNGYWLRRRSIAQSSHRHTKVTNTRTRTTNDQQNHRKEFRCFDKETTKSVSKKTTNESKCCSIKMLLNKNVAKKNKKCSSTCCSTVTYLQRCCLRDAPTGHFQPTTDRRFRSGDGHGTGQCPRHHDFDIHRRRLRRTGDRVQQKDRKLG